MKRSFNQRNNVSTFRNLVSLDGYIVHINPITKNSGNDNHHYSFIISLEDQSTKRVTKYLSKVPFCSLYDQLRASLTSGRGISISSLREQNEQYSCTTYTKLVEKEFNFRPNCIRVQHISLLKAEIVDQLCTVEAKVCYISDEISVTFEENEFKRIQKLKKNIIIGDSTGALEMIIWESHFNQVVLNNSYHIRLLKVRVYNDEISLIATTDTSFIRIDDLENVISEPDNCINRYHTYKGKIISIKKTNKQYVCQGCGGSNIVDKDNVISCNDCHARLLKDLNVIDDGLNIKIFTLNHEEYNLKLTKSLLLPILKNNADNMLNDNDYFNEDILNTIVSIMVQFTYNEISGIINQIEAIEDNSLAEKDQTNSSNK